MPRVLINGIQMHYEISGRGKAVLFCHGYTSSHQMWMHQIPILAQNYLVVTFDLRGHGSTDAPSSSEAYSISALAYDIPSLLDYLGIDKCCLVGHSMGGFIALQVILEYPRLISSLVLVGTSSGPSELPVYVELRNRLDEIARTEGIEAAFEYNAKNNPMAQIRFEKFPELREIVKRRALETSLNGYIYCGRAMSQRQCVTERLGEISAPTLVVVGEHDITFRQPSEVLAGGISGAKLCVMPGATHTPQEETPEIFNEALTSFLAEVE